MAGGLLPGSSGVVWGTSFDGTAVSGVVIEFIKLAGIYRDYGCRIHLDLGYDIKADKGNFFRPYSGETAVLPSWIRPDRVDGIAGIPGYGPDFVRQVLREVVQERDPGRLLPRVDRISALLARQIIRKWESLDVCFVVVENGTLPENITYTKALYAAIEEYGNARRLGKYVLWRDHDLMWTSEPGISKYGEFPFRETVHPVNSPFIRYVTLHEEARRAFLRWAPGLRDVVVLPNTFSSRPAKVDARNANFRSRFGIPRKAFLIARYTRLIPQKRIDRDIHLLAAVNAELAARGIGRPAYLFVAGDMHESPAEAARLAALAESLGVRHLVVFGGLLAPLDLPGSRGRPFSVRDLLAHADLACFLTSYDYESYGNPVGEAIASGVPYVTTRYQAYDSVYGDRGFHAPVLEISAADDGLPGAGFVTQVTDLLADAARRRELARFNYELGRSCFAPGRAEQLVREICRPEAAVGEEPPAAAPARADEPPATAAASVNEPWPAPPMRQETKVSVVLPVYDEAEHIGAVLRSLQDQRDDSGPLDRRGYEIILVDNNCTDETAEIAKKVAGQTPELNVLLITEREQGVACARKAGMELAVARSRDRDRRHGISLPFYLVSADADCLVDQRWLAELLRGMESSGAAIGVCDYYYPAAAFTRRPRLWDAIGRTLRCRQAAWRVFGGFPDGKGFAVDRDRYEKVGGIEIAYQLKDGRFRSHLSDDWDFGIKMRASGEDICYVPASRVEINPRRVDHAIEEVITGRAYGSGGIITMRDIRAPGEAAERARDLTAAQARQAWEFSIKDFAPKNLILPLLLSPSLAAEGPVGEFLTSSLARRLTRRAAQMRAEMSLTDFLPMHSYKTPCYRLYLEFADELFARLRAVVGDDIGYPPPLPGCFADVPAGRFAEFVRYYCEDRESGEAHDYFGNGGVF
jgi:glycosyltransferase involved in cell wall biosynthesis/GT2 family glycosyltransferase